MDSGKVFEKLMHCVVNRGLSVEFVPFTVSYARLKGDKIGIKQDMNIEDINYNLEHELAHSYLHYYKGNTIVSEYHEQYEK